MSHSTSSFPRSCIACAAGLALALLATAPAQAQTQAEHGLYLQGGSSVESNDHTDHLMLGYTWPMMSARPLWSGQLTGYYDAFIAEWRGDDASGNKASYTQIGIVPTLRYRFDGGASRWFTDAGLGLSYLDDIYTRPGHTFSTRFNFTERVALGYNFGATQAHEVSFGVQHFSNAGIKKPNPGETFAQVRYAYHF